MMIKEAHFYVDGKPMVYLNWGESTEHGVIEKTLRTPIEAIAPNVNHEVIRFVKSLIERYENKGTAKTINTFNVTQLNELEGVLSPELLEKLRVDIADNECAEKEKSFDANDAVLFAKGLQQLSERDIDASLLQELLNSGVKSLPEVIQLNQLTDKELKKYNKLYRKKKRCELQPFIDNFTGILKHV